MLGETDAKQEHCKRRAAWITRGGDTSTVGAEKESQCRQDHPGGETLHGKVMVAPSAPLDSKVQRKRPQR